MGTPTKKPDIDGNGPGQQGMAPYLAHGHGQAKDQTDHHGTAHNGCGDQTALNQVGQGLLDNV